MTIQESVNELSRLEEFFKSAPKPDQPIIIGGFMRLNNIQTFIDTNITRANIDIGNQRSAICISRLQQLEEFIIHNS